MGDYIPIEIDLERKTLGSERFFENRYNYVNDGKEESAIKNLEFLSFQKKTSLCITSEFGIRVINPSTKKVNYLKDESLFSSKNLITSSVLRRDGRLSGITMENNEIVILDVESGRTIRRFNKNSEPFISISFSFDKSKIVTGTVTGKISIYEISTGDHLLTTSAHSDTVKCILPISIELGKFIDENFEISDVKDRLYFITCSYDLNIHIWCFKNSSKDFRRDTEDLNGHSVFQLEIIRTYKHNFPIECISLTNENILISCGGTSIKIWNLKNPDLNCIHNIVDFGRTITTISSNKQFFVVGCLDHNIYIYDTVSYRFIRSFSFNRGVIKVAISECSTFISVALEDFSWLIKRRVNISEKQQISTSRDQEFVRIGQGYRTGTARYFKRGREMEGEEQDIKLRTSKKRQTRLNNILRSYSYKKALDIVLGMSWSHFTSLLHLLSSRGALHLIAREDDNEKIIKILKYLSNNMGKCTPSQFILISEMIEHILYENDLLRTSSLDNITDNIFEISECIKRISQKVSLEIKQHIILKEFRGVVETIIQNCKKNLIS